MFAALSHAEATRVKCEGTSWFLETLDTIGTLLDHMVSDLELGQRFEMWLVFANGEETKLGRSLIAARALSKAIASGQGSRLEIRGSQTACGAPPALEVQVL